jgi:TRAP transporter 4TM/12TM fusion protein
MGAISGSSIANTVTAGALTIPAMKRVGYPAHFSAAVEATASTAAQITPPILGAAAFIMVEYLEIPLWDVLAAALFPALLHYFGIFIMVHLEAKKLGLRAEELPKMGVVLKDHWLSLIPLVILVYFILSGKTPDFAAVYGIIACVVVGFLNPTNRLSIKDPWDGLASGAKNTLAVGAAAATVRVVVGVVTLTGVGYCLGYVVLQTTTDIGTMLSSLPILGYFTVTQWALFTSLILIAISCIIMGAGIPTTATYIILVAVAAPALAQLQVEPLVSHFFVFYYGVLADITPPRRSCSLCRRWYRRFQSIQNWEQRLSFGDRQSASAHRISLFTCTVVSCRRVHMVGVYGHPNRRHAEHRFAGRGIFGLSFHKPQDMGALVGCTCLVSLHCPRLGHYGRGHRIDVADFGTSSETQE